MDQRASDTAIALAALTICQNLIAVLMDRNLLTREDVEELLSDASQVGAADSDVNIEAGDVIREVMDGLTARHH
jgi:hypothetical protein